MVFTRRHSYISQCLQLFWEAISCITKLYAFIILFINSGEKCQNIINKHNRDFFCKDYSAQKNLKLSSTVAAPGIFKGRGKLISLKGVQILKISLRGTKSLVPFSRRGRVQLPVDPVFTQRCHCHCTTIQ